METVGDILAEMREYDNRPPPVRAWVDLANRIEAAYWRELNKCLKIDNAFVAQVAVLIDDHIKAIVEEVKRRCENGNR